MRDAKDYTDLAKNLLPGLDAYQIRKVFNLCPPHVDLHLMGFTTLHVSFATT